MRPKKTEKEDLDRICKSIRAVEDARAKGYTATVRDVCGALRCSRSYVDKHIKSQVASVYVPQSLMLFETSPGGLLYDENAFGSILAGATVERRSEWVMLDEMLPRECLAGLIERLRKVSDALQIGDFFRGSLALYHAQGGLNDFMSAHILDEWSEAYKSRVLVTKRTAADWLTCDFPAPKTLRELASSWQTPASMRNYGDTDEEVQRRIWREGRRRLTVTLPDGARRVFYSKPCEPPARDYLDDSTSWSPGIMRYASCAVAAQLVP